MNCHKAEALLAAYADNALPPEVAEEVRRHLSGCPACTGLAAEYRLLGEDIRLLPELEVTAAWTARVMTMIETPPRRVAAWWLGRVPAAAGIACATLAAWCILASPHVLSAGLPFASPSIHFLDWFSYAARQAILATNAAYYMLSSVGVVLRIFTRQVSSANYHVLPFAIAILSVLSLLAYRAQEQDHRRATTTFTKEVRS
ncbi:zf-HC2 domain-containing protein [bacterium]|nr:zf-HC2 domain-containing protein [candidate division CSSED10-310 bacterium]